MTKRDDLRETLEVDDSIRKTMRSNRSKDTGPELALRKAVWNAGMRGYRVNCRKLPGSPDIVFGPAHLAIFVHGCFWHGCPHCQRYRSPRKNAEFWRAKLEENTQRDRRSAARLGELGYEIMVVWECEIEMDLDRCVAAVVAALNSRPRTKGRRAGPCGSF